jgi:hypothetical protein
VGSDLLVVQALHAPVEYGTRQSMAALPQASRACLLLSVGMPMPPLCTCCCTVFGHFVSESVHPSAPLRCTCSWKCACVCKLAAVPCRAAALLPAASDTVRLCGCCSLLRCVLHVYDHKDVQYCYYIWQAPTRLLVLPLPACHRGRRYEEVQCWCCVSGPKRSSETFAHRCLQFAVSRRFACRGHEGSVRRDAGATLHFPV